MAGVETAVRINIEGIDNLNARDKSGFTSLRLTAVRNRLHIFQLILEVSAAPFRGRYLR